MVFIIQNYFVRAYYNDEKDLIVSYMRLFLPSFQNEQKHPITVMRL